MHGTDKSSSPEGSLDVTLKPELGAALTTLAATIERFAAEHGIAGEVPFRLNLALDELVTNCINYALSGVAEPRLHMRLTRDADSVVAQLEDNGPAFNPFEEAPPPDTSGDLDERPIGGLGVFLVEQFSDDATYEREGGVNRIALRMKLEVGAI